MAARDGNLEALKEAVAAGWDPSSVDRNGSNAMHWACGGGHLEVGCYSCLSTDSRKICRYLAEHHGVSPESSKNKNHRNSLHWAARNGRLNICKWLINEQGCFLFSKQLIVLGMDVNSVSSDGATAFRWACWQNHFEVARFGVFGLVFIL